MDVTYEVTDRVAVVTIDRPDQRNAMDLGVFDGLGEAAARAGDDPVVRAVLVRGAGDHFSSGIDVAVLGELTSHGELDGAAIARLQASFTAFEELDVPTVAAIDGVCFGAGIQLAAACHLRCVAPGAQLSVLEVRWALVPDLGGTYRLPRLVGLGRATELVATGRRVGQEEAVAIGLADRAVGSLDEAAALARELAAAPRSVPRAIRLLRENLERGRDAALAAEAAAQLDSLAHPDFAATVEARVAGREPIYD